jgi:hypothetical protein
VEQFRYKKIYIENYEQIISEIRSKILENEQNLKWGYDLINKQDFLNSCPKFHNFIVSKGLTIRVIAVIKIKAHRNSEIHIDDIKGNFNRYALNMGIFNYEDTRTQMFSTKDTESYLILNDAGHPYLKFDETNCKLIEEFDLIQPTIFDTSIPHRVSNNTNKHRISISFRFLNDPFNIL